MYPPNFEVIIDGRSAVGNARLTASFTGIECPLVVEIPLLLPASKQYSWHYFQYIKYTELSPFCRYTT